VDVLRDQGVFFGHMASTRLRTGVWDASMY
jgi:hypothetical protein